MMLGVLFSPRLHVVHDNFQEEENVNRNALIEHDKDNNENPMMMKWGGVTQTAPFGKVYLFIMTDSGTAAT